MILASHEDTLNLGKKIGDVLKPGDILLLEGDLGAGKTTFTQGLAEGLGVDEFVNSPTFVIINEYFSGHLPLYHMDLYRLEDEAQLSDLGVEEYFFGNGVSVVEWPEIALSLLPEAYTRLTFLREGQGREVKITTRGNDYHIEEAFNEYFSL